MAEWLGHRDLCSIQWSEYCDCLPGEPVYLGDAEDAETEDQQS